MGFQFAGLVLDGVLEQSGPYIDPRNLHCKPRRKAPPSFSNSPMTLKQNSGFRVRDLGISRGLTLRLLKILGFGRLPTKELQVLTVG